MLELLIVLFLLSIIAAMAAPRLLQVYQSFGNRIDKDEIVIQIANIGTKVMKRGVGGKIAATIPKDVINNALNITAENRQPPPPLPYELPAGWKLKTAKDIIWLDSGVCLGGTLHAFNQQTRLTMVLKRPFCQPETIH